MEKVPKIPWNFMEKVPKIDRIVSANPVVKKYLTTGYVSSGSRWVGEWVLYV